MNGKALIDAVYERTNYRTDDPQITRAKVLGWLNYALRAYQSHVPGAAWLTGSQNISATASTGSYSFNPASLQEVRHVTWVEGDGRRQVLDRVSLQTMDDFSTFVEGVPLYWAYEEGTLYVWPVPTHAATLEVDFTVSESALLDVTTSTPQLPAELHDVLVDHAVRSAHLATGNHQASEYFLPIDSPLVVSKLRRANAARKGSRRQLNPIWRV